MHDLDRRELLRHLALGLVATPFATSLIGCSDASSSMADAADPTGDGTRQPDSSTAGTWATGGTVSMTD